MRLPVGALSQRSGHAPVQIMLFLWAKSLLKVRLDSAFCHPGQPFENCQFLRPELSDGCICFTADKDFSVESPRPLRMERDTNLSEERGCWSSCRDAVTCSGRGLLAPIDLSRRHVASCSSPTSERELP